MIASYLQIGRQRWNSCRSLYTEISSVGINTLPQSPRRKLISTLPPFYSLPSPSTIYANAFLFCVRAESPVDNTLARLRPPPYKSQALLRVFCDMLYKLSSLLPWKASLDPKLPLFAPVSFNVPLTYARKPRVSCFNGF